MIGAEPTTSPLPRVCSTTELHGHRRSNLERETGLEPATLCLEGRYSSQLSYSRPSECPNQIFPIKHSKWWAGKDSNLRRRKPADLQSAPFSHSGTYPDCECLLREIWSWLWDSNPQPADYKSAALPIELNQLT